MNLFNTSRRPHKAYSKICNKVQKLPDFIVVGIVWTPLLPDVTGGWNWFDQWYIHLTGHGGWLSFKQVEYCHGPLKISYGSLRKKEYIANRTAGKPSWRLCFPAASKRPSRRILQGHNQILVPWVTRLTWEGLWLIRCYPWMKINSYGFLGWSFFSSGLPILCCVYCSSRMRFPFATRILWASVLRYLSA